MTSRAVRAIARAEREVAAFEERLRHHRKKLFEVEQRYVNEGNGLLRDAHTSLEAAEDAMKQYVHLWMGKP